MHHPFTTDIQKPKKSVVGNFNTSKDPLGSNEGVIKEISQDLWATQPLVQLLTILLQKQTANKETGEHDCSKKRKLYGHWNLNFIQFLHVTKYYFDFFNHLKS